MEGKKEKKKNVKTVKGAKNHVGVAMPDGYVVKVRNVMETFGHDDTLPYNALWSVERNGVFLGEGRAWNDGWGGESVMENGGDYDPCKELDAICKQRFVDRSMAGLVIEYGFTDIIDTLVLIFLTSEKNRGKVFSEEAVSKYINRP